MWPLVFNLNKIDSLNYFLYLRVPSSATFMLKKLNWLATYNSSCVRISHLWCSIKKTFLKTFAIFTGKYLCWNLILITLQVAAVHFLSWKFHLVEIGSVFCLYLAAQKMKFSIKDLFSKCDQIRSKLHISKSIPNVSFKCISCQEICR